MRAPGLEDSNKVANPGFDHYAGLTTMIDEQSSEKHVSAKRMPFLLPSIALVPVRNGEPERGALADRRLYPDESAEVFDYFSAERQADAAAGVLVAIEAVEDHEDFFGKLRVDANSIVLDRKHPFPSRVPRGGDVDVGWLVAAVFDGVADEILEYLYEGRL